MGRVGIELNVNRSGDAASRRKWQRRHLEVGPPEALEADRCANGGTKHNQPEGSERGWDDQYGVRRPEALRHSEKADRQGKHVHEYRGDPQADRALFVLTLHAGSGPIRPPEPWPTGIG